MSGRRRLGPLIVLIGVAGVGTWLFLREKPVSAPTSDATRPAAAAPHAPASANGNATTTPLPPATPPTPGDATLLVRVKGPDGQALAGVPVAFTARKPGDTAPARDIALARSGPAGEAARLELPPELFAASWDASLEYSLSTAITVPGAPVVVLTQRPQPGQSFELALPEAVASWCRPLEVRVLSAQGELLPHVALLLVLRPGASAAGEQVLGRVVSDENGQASVALGDWWEAAWPWRRPGVSLSPLIRTEAPFRSPVEALLRTDREAPQRVELKLPAAGWLDVYVADADGQPVPAASLDVHWEVVSDQQRDNDRFAARVLEDGIARAGPLALGRLLTIDVRDTRTGARVEANDVSGPMSGDSISSLALRLPPAKP